MNFENWLIESSLNDLYQSAVRAFPNTTKRQHAVDPIEIANLQWTPFLGMKTLLLRATAINEAREYNPIILFKNVQYHVTRDVYGLIEIVDNMGTGHLIEKLSLENTDARLRCDCNDFKWRFNYTDHQDQSLYGRKRREYHALHNPGSSNPQNLPGMCKHLIKLTQVLNIFE
jgi:hypothetical protein